MTAPSFEAFRASFPITARLRYLNAAAETPLPDFVRRAVEEHLDLLAEGAATVFERHVERAARCRDRLAALTSLDGRGMALTKNTTQGVWIAAQSLPLEAGDHVLLNELEFPANVLPWRIEAERAGWVVDVIPPREGRVGPAEVEAALHPRTRAVAISWVQFASGDRVDLEALSALCRSRGIYLFVDVIQGVGALDFRPFAGCADMVASGAHKWLLGLAGCGFFWCRPELIPTLRLANLGWTSVRDPFRWVADPDWRDDGMRFEEGNQSWAGIYALDAALGRLLELGPERVEGRILALRRRLVEGLADEGCPLVGPDEKGAPSGIVVFRSPREETEALHGRLSRAGVVTAVRGGGVRVSPHVYNDETDVDALLAVVAEGRSS